MKQNQISRRKLLRISGVTAGTSAVGALTGCLGGVPLADSASIGSYSDWLYEPGTGSDNEHYRFQFSQPSYIEENEDSFDEWLYDNITSVDETYSFLDLDIEDIDMFLYFDQAVTVLAGSYTTEDIIEELEDNDYDEETDHEGYTIYLAEDEATAVGVGDRALLVATNIYQEAVDLVETVIDTELGEEDRYMSESSTFSTLSDNLDTGAFISGTTHEPTESISGTESRGAESITYGETVESELNSNNSTGEYGNRYHEFFTFIGEEGNNITIEMQSTQGDSYLLLEGSDGNVLAENDDGGGSYNSRINYTLSQTGRYTIVATSYNEETTFGYTLSLTSNSDPLSEAALGRFEDEVARGSAVTINGDTASRRWVVVFDAEDDIDIDNINEWVEEGQDSGEQFEDYTDFNTTKQGRAVLIDATIDTDDLQKPWL